MYTIILNIKPSELLDKIVSTLCKITLEITLFMQPRNAEVFQALTPSFEKFLSWSEVEIMALLKGTVQVMMCSHQMWREVLP